MSTDIATRLNAALEGRYRIERELGTGGMATVFLADDLKHDRKVALKVLKPELAAVLGAERFVVEIKTTASLQHPHILPLFDSGTADGFLFYVMPYIQGETIREKLNRETQFGVDEAVRIAREIADALDYAHRAGVIHRDIKPENILLHDGRAMVMDFGIALAVSAAAGGRMTETGLSLGTPHYMSPEQATAEKDLTPRADVYSLASVLYEMLTGNPPHTGATVQQIIMKIITEAVEPVTKYRKTVPPHVVGAVARALEKLPADRFESAKAFRDALGSEGFSYATAAAGVTAANPSGSASGRWGGRRALIAACAVAVVAIAAAAAGWLRKQPEAPFRRFDLSTGAVVPAAFNEVVVSPDGSTIALVGDLNGERAIYLRHLDGEAEFRKLAGTESGANPAFSPDGQWIAFRRNSDRSLVKIPVVGGGAITIVPQGKLDAFFPNWGAPDVLTFSTPGGNYRVSPDGGEPKPLRGVTSRRTFVLPDGSGVLHSSGVDVLVYDFEADSSILLVKNSDGPSYVPTGHLLYNTPDGGTFAVTFDLRSRRVGTSPIRVFERVAANSAVRGYSISSNGVVVLHEGDGTGIVSTNTIALVDPGKTIDTVRTPPARHAKLRVSPDGRKLAMEVFAERGNGATDIYTLDLVTGTYTQVTFDGDNDEPVWSPDGKRLLYDKVVGTPGEELFVKPANNEGGERRLTSLGGTEVGAQQWLDDKTLVFDAQMRDGATEIFIVGADSGSQPVAYIKSPFNERQPRVSSDRKLIAFLSDEQGTNQLWLRDFPTPQGKWNVSRGTAAAPRWSPDGKYLYFWRSGSPLDTLFRARVDRTPGVVVQAPEFVAALDVDGIVSWDLHPDGRRFFVPLSASAVPAAASASRPSRFLILQNWFGELKRLTTPRAK